MAPAPEPDPKLEELRKRGALHPHPEDVSDDLFAEHDFFDPRDAIQSKYEMLRRVRVDGLPVAHAARSFGFSRPTFYKARADFGREGLPGLLPAKPGPRSAHKLSPEVMAYVADLLGDQPSLGAPELAERIHKRFDLVVHPRSVERALARREKGGA
jgi:transposase